MKNNVAISVLGKDRPGIVAAVSRALFETGCNIEDSSMTLLRSEFAMILLAALPAGKSISALRQALKPAVRNLGLSVAVRPLTSGEKAREIPAGRQYVASIYGADKPGIVYRISNFLADNDINITDVQTNMVPCGPAATYIMLLEIDLPAHVKVRPFTSRLKKLGRTLKVTVALNPADAPRL